MIPQREKNVIRKRVHVRIREKLAGTAARPRLNVYRSLNHIYVQLIDDMAGKTIVSASTNEKAETKGSKAKGVTQVVFDRGGYIYHGRVKALADAAREAGLKF